MESKVETLYTRKQFLNGPDSPSLGFVQAFAGKFTDKDGEDLSAWLRIGDCHTISCLHKADFDTIEDFTDKMRKLRGVLDNFIGFLEHEFKLNKSKSDKSKSDKPKSDESKSDESKSDKPKYVIGFNKDFFVISISKYEKNLYITDTCTKTFFGIDNDGYVYKYECGEVPIEEWYNASGVNSFLQDQAENLFHQAEEAFWKKMAPIPDFVTKYSHFGGDAIDISEFASEMKYLNG